MSRIQVTPPEDATGQLKEIYDEWIEKRGNFSKELTLNLGGFEDDAQVDRLKEEGWA